MVVVLTGTPKVDEAEGAAGLEFFNRVVVRIDAEYENIRGDLERGTGSGVLARIGDVTLVLTAGHLLLERQARELTVAFPRLVSTVSRVRPRIVRLGRTWEPDVGYIELDELDAALWAHMTPVTAPALGVSAPSIGDDVFVFGAPDALSNQGIGLHTCVVAAPDGAVRRGFHVQYGPRLALHRGDRAIDVPAPPGISGGPVFARNICEPKLLGIASAIFDRLYERCEETAAMLDLLATHPSEHVRRAVAEIRSKGP